MADLPKNDLTIGSFLSLNILIRSEVSRQIYVQNSSCDFEIKIKTASNFPPAVSKKSSPPFSSGAKTASDKKRGETFSCQKSQASLRKSNNERMMSPGL